jgi:hypothetical protein
MKLSKAELLAPEIIAAFGQSDLDRMVDRAMRRYTSLPVRQQVLLRHAQRINFVFDYLGIDGTDCTPHAIDLRESIARRVITRVSDERRADLLMEDMDFRTMIHLQ